MEAGVFYDNRAIWPIKFYDLLPDNVTRIWKLVREEGKITP